MNATVRPAGRSELTHEGLLALLHYDPVTGVFVWRRRPIAMFRDLRACEAWNGRYAGKTAGAVDKIEGYIRIGIGGREYWAHRVAWFYVHGTWPAHDVDHKDRIRHHNWIENLRPVTRAMNLQNQVDPSSRSTTGIRGVYWDADRQRWRVEISINDKNKFIGRFRRVDEAIAAREAAVRRHHPGAIL